MGNKLITTDGTKLWEKRHRDGGEQNVGKWGYRDGGHAISDKKEIASEETKCCNKKGNRDGGHNIFEK